MTNQEAIELIKVAQAEVEWSCPMGYAAAFDLAIKSLEAWDELYKQIYDHHYEIIKSEPSESRNAKLSLSNWILDIMTGYDFEPQESEDKG